MLCRLRRDERGVALVVALLVVFTVMTLSLVVVGQAIHNSESSAYNRRRLQSVGAAEAGIDYSYNLVEGSTPTSLAASGCSATQDLGTAPQLARFTATITLYDASGIVIPCALAASQTPASALIRSTGTVNGQVPRTMESYVRLVPSYGGFDEAILSDAGLNLVNNLTLNGYQGNDANVWVNSSDLTISNNATISGGVYAAGGGGTISNNATVKGDVWVNGPLLLQNSALVQANATSSTSSVTLTNSAQVSGNVTAGTTISGGGIGGVQTPNHPSATPPTKPLPQITANTAAWTSAGYSLQSYPDCASAQNALANQTQTGNVLVRIAAVCQLSFTGNTSVGFNGNLAILTDGSIRSANNVHWNGTGGSRHLYLIAAYRSGLSCAGGSYDVVDVNNVSYNSTDVLFYSPCTVSIANNTGFSGQILARTAVISNNFTMNFRPMVVPGTSAVGFQQDIAFIREVL